jgi:hypothetical protein
MPSTTIGGVPVTTAHYARFSASLVSGLVASIAGGVVMAAVMVVAFVVGQHTSALFPLRPIGTYLFGDRMLVAPTAGMYAAAIAFHFAVCAIWGIVFAFAATLLRADKSFGGALVVGIIIGLASQIIDVNIVSPAWMAARWGQDLWTATVPPLYSWLGHVAFGLTFVIVPLMFRPLWLRWSGRSEIDIDIDIDWDDPRIR